MELYWVFDLIFCKMDVFCLLFFIGLSHFYNYNTTLYNATKDYMGRAAS